MWTSLKHWWQRNFGYVYLKDESVLGDGRQYRFRTKRGRVAFVWRIIDGTKIPFFCRLAENGKVQNEHNEVMDGYGQQYGGWRWSYDEFQPGAYHKGGYWR